MSQLAQKKPTIDKTTKIRAAATSAGCSLVSLLASANTERAMVAAAFLEGAADGRVEEVGRGACAISVRSPRRFLTVQLLSSDSKVQKYAS